MSADGTASGRELPIELLNERRRLAVKLRLRGMKLAEVAEHAGLSVPTVIAAHKAYMAGGWDAVAVQPRGRKAGSGRVLSPEVELRLLGSLHDRSPAAFGLAGELWSETGAQALLLGEFGIEISMRSMRRYLEAWGLKLKEPSAYLRESRNEAVRKGLPALLAQYEGLPARDRGALVWLRTHALLTGSEGGNDPSKSFLVAHSQRGSCHWAGIDEPPGLEAIADFLQRLHREEGRPLWIVASGLDFSRRSGLEEELACNKGVVLRTLPASGTTTRYAVNQWSGEENRNAQAKNPPLPVTRAPARGAGAAETTAHRAPQPNTTSQPKNATMSFVIDPEKLTHLERLEAESIHIMREVVAETENPVMLYSIGKDSAVMLHLAMKAFYPSKPPFPLLHVDSKWKFREMYLFRDRMAEELGMDLLVHSNADGEAMGINPFTHGSAIHTDVMKTQALKQALDKYGFDAAFGGARRDEEKSRAKERIFSFRTAQHRWDPKSQRPELWKLYNARKHKGESIRVFPLSNWTELDIWQYIYLKNIPIVPLYCAADRPVVERDGALIMVDDDRIPLKAGEVPMVKKVRFRTLGCYPLTGAVESEADTLPAIIQEILLARSSERQGRVIDQDAGASMEQKKQEGYF